MLHIALSFSLKAERTHYSDHQSQPRHPSLSNRSSSDSLASLQDEDHDTLAMSIDLQQPLHPHEGYSSLWEIQLELGEIPDMISNNLLTPCDEHPPQSEGGFFVFGCSPSSRLTLYDLVDEQGEIDRVAMTLFDQVEEGEEDVKEGREDSTQSEPLALFGLLSSPPYTPFTDLMEESSTGACLRLSSLDEQEYGDGDYGEELERRKEEGEEVVGDGNEDEDVDEEALEKKEGSRVLSHPLNHPIYGMLGTIGDERDDPEIDQVGNELFRHDRKDSGVFLQQGKDSGLTMEPLDILRLLAVV